jgi:hypothetical protein
MTFGSEIVPVIHCFGGVHAKEERCRYIRWINRFRKDLAQGCESE